MQASQYEMDTKSLEAFALAGSAVFTVESPKGTRFTYRVSAGKPDPRPAWFVSVLTGPDNSSDFSYACFIGEDKKIRPGKKSAVNWNSPSVQNLRWLWSRVLSGKGLSCDSGTVKVYHVGRCGRCGRDLTVPESIKTGLGPHCARLAASASAPRQESFN